MITTRPLYYYLKDHEPVPVHAFTDPAYLAWHARKDEPGYPDNRHVGIFDYRGVRVSTVFLLVDHNFNDDGPPILYETMVFAASYPKLDEHQWRWTTWDEAWLGHATIVERVKEYLTLLDADAKADWSDDE